MDPLQAITSPNATSTPKQNPGPSPAPTTSPSHTSVTKRRLEQDHFISRSLQLASASIMDPLQAIKNLDATSTSHTNTAATPAPDADQAPSTTSPPPSPFLHLPLGFPRVIDVPAYLQCLQDKSPPFQITIADLVVTVLYNHDLDTGKKALEAFLDFANTEFCFVSRDLREEEGGVHFHIEREENVVLCGHQSLPGAWQDHYVYRIEPSGVWTIVPIDADGSGLLVARDALDERNVKAFCDDVLGNVKWIARVPDSVIEIAVKHAI
ncbi:MAG: hypothetical protein Q9170_007803 [Blastenia crenularia]